MTEEVEKALTVLGDVEALFSDVEISLLALEDTIDARELQEKQLEQRLKLDMHQERRKANFNEVSNQLEGEYQKKKVESDKRKVLASQERQKLYQDQFERDMNAYRASGKPSMYLLFISTYRGYVINKRYLPMLLAINTYLSLLQVILRAI